MDNLTDNEWRDRIAAARLEGAAAHHNSVGTIYNPYRRDQDLRASAWLTGRERAAKAHEEALRRDFVLSLDAVVAA